MNLTRPTTRMMAKITVEVEKMKVRMNDDTAPFCVSFRILGAWIALAGRQMLVSSDVACLHLI